MNIKVNKATQDFVKLHEEKMDYLLWEEKFNQNTNYAYKNYITYQSLTKGEKSILRRMFTILKDDSDFYSTYGTLPENEDISEEYRDRMNRIDDKYKTLLSSDCIDLSRPSSEHMRKLKQRTLDLDNERIEFLNILIDELLFWGIAKENFEIEYFNLNYKKLLEAINKIKGFKNFSLAKLYLSVHTIMTYKNDDGLIEAPATVWAALFTSSYKTLLKKIPFIFELKHKGIMHFRSARYEVGEKIVSKGFTKIFNEKTIKDFKKITLTKYKYTIAERKALRDDFKKTVATNVMSMFNVMESARKYVMSDFSKHNLEKKYSWLAKEAYREEAAITLEDDKEDFVIHHWEIFGAYYYTQIKSIIDNGEYMSYEEFAEEYIVMHAPEAEEFEENEIALEI